MTFSKKLEKLITGLDISPEDTLPKIKALCEGYPKEASGWHVLGGAYLLCGDRFLAEVYLYKAISLAKRDHLKSSRIWYDLGLVFEGKKALLKAEAAFKKACKLDPLWHAPCYNLGLLYFDRNQDKHAHLYFKKSIALNPDFALGYNNLGVYYRRKGLLRKALEYSEKAYRLDPENPLCRTNLSYMRLMFGKFDEAWPLYESRFDTPMKWIRPNLATPKWQGKIRPGIRLFVHHEQGLGDSLQFCRLLYVLSDAGINVIFQPQKPLYSLLCHSFASSDIVVVDHIPADDQYDYWTTLLSLPHFLDLTLEIEPTSGPYLFPPAERVDEMAPYFETSRALKVGLVWQQGVFKFRHFENNRSIGLREFLHFLSDHRIQFYSFQKTFGLEDLPEFEEQGLIVDMGKHFETFEDTAAAAAHLDLMICIDTSVAHLSAGMGVPTWIPLPKSPCWRWVRHREFSPWYPSVRLFRQKRLDGWDPVFQDIKAGLAELLSGKV